MHAITIYKFDKTTKIKEKKMKSEKLIKKYIIKVINECAFTWTNDVLEHSIWGFKNAPYKNFKKAQNKVNSVIKEMEEEGVIMIDANKDTNDNNNYTITPGKYFNL